MGEVMSYTINIQDDRTVDVDVNYNFIDALVSKFEDRARYDKDEENTSSSDARLLRKLLNRIKGSSLYNVDGYIEDIEIEADDIEHIISNEIAKGNRKYRNNIYSKRNAIIENNSSLIHKIDQVAYNFGNKKELTREDAIEIRKFIDNLVDNNG